MRCAPAIPFVTPTGATRSVPRVLLGVMIAVLVIMSFPPMTQAAAVPRALVLEIDGAIGPAMADYVVRALHGVDAADTRIVILRMNTPGGLDRSMRDIIRAILASPVPVATYVAPSGARAASAGTYIAYASAIAAMAPGTNIGAATPVQLGFVRPPGGSADQPAGKGGEEPRNLTEPADAETRKIVNDAVAYIQGLAMLNGRNADWAAEAVRMAASLPASEALKLHVIDVVADSLPALLDKVDGRTVMVAGKPQRLATTGLDITTVPPDWRTTLLAVITDPTVAFLLMLVGAAGLVFEFLTPGTILPGLIGSISLLLALYALNLLPINYSGAVLVLLGLGLMVAEVHIGSFGVLGIGGIVALAIGAIMMFPSRAPGFALSRPVVVVTTVVAAGLLLVVGTITLRSRRRPIVTGTQALLGAGGETVGWDGAQGRVLVNGEIWRARSPQPLRAGIRIRVIDREGLVLVVEPA